MAETSPEFRRLSEDAVRRRTGRGWVEWVSILDDWGATQKGQEASAKHLVESYGLSPWWARAVVERYAQEHGRAA